MKRHLNNTKQKAAMLIVLTLLLITTSTISAAPIFSDLKNVPWAEKEILYLHKRGVVTGLPDGSFGVTENIKRADAAVMLVRAKGLDTNNVTTQIPFSDVNENTYYFEAVQAAVLAGYLSGYLDGTFRPDKPLTRAEMATIIAVAYDYTLPVSSEILFYDTLNSWAKDFIHAIAANGITNGSGNGTFKPNSYITRAEFSVMLARAMNDEFKVNPEEIERPTIEDLLPENELVETIEIDGGSREPDGCLFCQWE